MLGLGVIAYIAFLINIPLFSSIIILALGATVIIHNSQIKKHKQQITDNNNDISGLQARLRLRSMAEYALPYIYGGELTTLSDTDYWLKNLPIYGFNVRIPSMPNARKLRAIVRDKRVFSLPLDWQSMRQVFCVKFTGIWQEGDISPDESEMESCIYITAFCRNGQVEYHMQLADYDESPDFASMAKSTLIFKCLVDTGVVCFNPGKGAFVEVEWDLRADSHMFFVEKKQIVKQ